METTIVHQGRDGRWRWHTVDLGNHKIIATSGESFASEHNAKRAAEGAKESIARASIHVARRKPVRVLARASAPASPLLARGRTAAPALPQMRGRTAPAQLRARRLTPTAAEALARLAQRPQ